MPYSWRLRPPAALLLHADAGVQPLRGQPLRDRQTVSRGLLLSDVFRASPAELIRVCSLVGSRQEGEMCHAWTRDPEYGCERGLLCHTRCGRPCEPGDPSTCPEGFFCEEARAGAACQPTCEGRTCPEGQRCIGVGGKRSLCAKVHGRDCQSEPCGPGQQCSVSAYPRPAREVWMQCTQTCGLEGKPPCPEGSVCEDNQCLTRCSPDSRCAEGFKCAGPPSGPTVCMPDVPASLP